MRPRVFGGRRAAGVDWRSCGAGRASRTTGGAVVSDSVIDGVMRLGPIAEVVRVA